MTAQAMRAALLRQIGEPLVIEQVQLEEPRSDEVLVRIVATGICHTDLLVQDGHFPPSPPALLGHEGSGVVQRVGSNVTHVVPGDHVVLSFASCGECEPCLSDRPTYCEQFFLYNMHGSRPDGSMAIHSADGPVACCFFGQSSFATHAISHKRAVVKVRKDAPLELLGPLGCGVQTGAGAVLNVLKPEQGSSFAVFGCGAVGLSALMAAKLSECGMIIAVDTSPARLQLAAELGATHLIDAQTEDPVEEINALGGVRYVIEATGVPAVLEQAVQVMVSRGVCGILGGHSLDATVSLNVHRSIIYRTISGIVGGDSDLHGFIPLLVDKFMDGKFPFDRLCKFYAFEDINQAIADAKSGDTVKPIVQIS